MIYSLPAAIAVSAFAILVGVLNAHINGVVGEHIRAIAPLMFEQKILGSAFQRTAFRNPELLPIFGSSELLAPNAYHANAVFRKYPSGFTAFPVGKADTTPVIILQKLAAIGAELRGKKLVIMLTPGCFYGRRMVPPEAYAGNFSRLHANELVFSTDLSIGLKRAAAERMLSYEETLEPDQLLQLAARSLGTDSLENTLLYYACLPLGKIRNIVLRLQDQWETYQFICRHPNLDPPIHQEPARLDWSGLLTSAERDYKRRATNNPFGIENSRWLTKFSADASEKRGKFTDRVFLEGLDRAKEWTDLDLLMQALKELGAHPLFLSMPIHDAYSQQLGTSASSRAAYYARLRQAIARYDVPFLDLAEYGGDTYFLCDPNSHLSDKGWVVIDQTLDAFYFNVLN